MSSLQERIKSARLMNSLSLQELAEKLSKTITITRQALNKYETGEVIPSDSMLQILSSVLNIRTEYFRSDAEVSLGKIEFRKLTRFPVKEKNKIVESTRYVLERYLKLENVLGLNSAFVNPIEGHELHTIEDVEVAAELVRERWGIGQTSPIFNVIEMLEDNHIKVIEIGSEDSIDGLQMLANKSIPVIVLNSNKVKSLDRKRFTALHELAHLILELDHLDEKIKELYCHRFAAAMLFPRETARKELGEKRSNLSINELGAIKKQYGISIHALAYRARDLNFISENYLRQFQFMLGQMGWKIVEPVEYLGDERALRFDQLLYRAISEKQISVEQAAILDNKSVLEFRKKLMNIE